MPVPSHAMVLAAGLGLRMRPLTLERPKPLLTVAGRTLLDHALDRLAEAGVGTAVVNTHHKAEMVAAHLAGRAGPPRVARSHEDVLLETGGGCRKALPLLGDGPFVLVNADDLWLDGPTPAVRRLADAWDPERMDVLLLVMAATRAIGHDGPGDYHMDPLGRLTRRGEGEIAPFVFAGVAIVAPSVYAGTPDGPFSNLLVFDRAQEAGRLYGIAHDGAWFHVGTPEALDEAERLFDRGGVRWLWP